jgi:hypothetical protein
MLTAWACERARIRKRARKKARIQEGAVVKQDVKALLGLTRDDLWALPGVALMSTAFFFSDLRVVGGLLAGACFCLSIYLLRMLKRYLRGPGFTVSTRVLGVVGNLLVLALLGAMAAGMVHLAAEGRSAFDFVQQQAASYYKTNEALD